MKYVKLVLCSLSLIAFLGCNQSKNATIPEPGDLGFHSDEISSPNGILKLNFFLFDGVPFYEVSRKGHSVVDKSRLGFRLNTEAPFGNFKVENTEKSAFDETWTQPWGEVKDIRNNYEEMKIFLINPIGKKLNVVFRVYDYGIGFRYEWPEQDNLKDFVIQDELTEFNIPTNPTSWWIPAYVLNRSEHLYRETPLSEIDTVQTPITMKTKMGLYLSIHEANLTDYASMSLANKGNGLLEADLVPWKNGDKVYASTPFVSPWRTIQIAEKSGDLITDYLILNLNEPSKIEDTSWIKPAKYAGIWWDMHLGTKTWESGPKHGATTEYAKYMMDFAARHGLKGVLVEGWNIGWNGDWFMNGDVFSFTQPYPDFDIEEVVRYGDSLGVKLIGHHETSAGISNYEKQVDDAFAMDNRLGINTVKTGYVGDFVEGGEWHHGQFMVRHYRKIVEKAAKAHIMLDVHEPIKDTGIRRTWPNMMTREGARGREYDAWSEDGGNPPSHTTTIPFTRLLGGPMDYTPGTFNLLLTDKINNPYHDRVQSTLAKELALYVVLYSPLQMVSDLPKNLEANPTALKFIEDVPCDWEKTVIVDSEIGDFIVTARKDRNSDDWYLGAITNEDKRTFFIDLNFLEEGKTYEAQIYTDGTADWINNPLVFTTMKQEVHSDDEFYINMGPGGGMAVRFKALD